MEKPSGMPLLQLPYLRPPSQEDDGSCNRTTCLRRYLTRCENSPFNGLLYAELEVIALYSYEHKGNYIPTECIGGHVNKISTPLIVLVHFYRTEIKMGMNWLKNILTLQTNKWRVSAKAG